MSTFKVIYRGFMGNCGMFVIMQPLVHTLFIACTIFPFLAYCAKAANASNEQQEDSERSQNLQDEVLNFPTNCPDCAAPADTKMKLTSEFF